jgi:hypothetical protein
LIGVNVSGKKQTVRFCLPQKVESVAAVALPGHAAPQVSVLGKGVVELDVEPCTIFCVEEKRERMSP